MPLAMTLHRFGVGNLCSEHRSPEVIGDAMVRIALQAVALNYRDILVMRGTYGPGLALPLIPCSDGAGIVLDVGADVSDLRPGDHICTHMVPDWQVGPLEPRMRLSTLGGPEQGVLCEERVLPRRAVVPIPEELAFEQAACLPVAGLAAWCALTGGHIQRGSRVLLLGTGGVSMMALTIAKALGARIAVTSSSDEKLARVRALGAELAVNYRKEAWAERVREWSEGGVDIVLEIGGEGTLGQSVRATRDGGYVALLGVLAHCSRVVNLSEILMRQIRLHGIFVGSRAELERYVTFVAAHGIEPVIDRVFNGLATARHAFAHLLTGRHLGKVLIRIST
jgi:NADPH:quinone reductase-like Zn-dependent oxidoreductase